VLSLVEGRLVEVMLGERMPAAVLHARQATAGADQELFTDPRTWATQLYFR
jgi:hypothetical protein